VRRDLEQQLIDSTESLSLVIGADKWDLYVFGATRVERDWFVQIAIVGPRACTVTVRVTSTSGHAAAARAIVSLVRDWVLSGGDTDHAFLECAPPVAQAS
jgi:hypothetical protein